MHLNQAGASYVIKLPALFLPWQLKVSAIRLFFFYLVGLRNPSQFDFRKSKIKDKMIAKVSQTPKIDCLACCLHKNLGKIHYNDNHSTIIDVLNQN